MKLDWDDLISKLPGVLKKLERSRPFQGSGDMSSLPASGVYVSYKNGKAIYTGKASRMEICIHYLFDSFRDLCDKEFKTGGDKMIKNRIVTFLVTLLMIYGFANFALAVPLSGQYTIAASATTIDADSWIFEYSITNINQGDPGASYFQGLGGFYLMIPENAIISNVSNPPAYVPMWGVYWDNYIDLSSPLNGNFRDPSYPVYWNDETELNPDSYWLGWWGNGMPSVYPIGSTASFSFRADGVVPGLNTGVVVTFWGPGQYAGYSTEILSPLPSAIPESATFMLVGAGIAGMIGLRRFLEN